MPLKKVEPVHQAAARENATIQLGKCQATDADPTYI